MYGQGFRGADTDVTPMEIAPKPRASRWQVMRHPDYWNKVTWIFGRTNFACNHGVNLMSSFSCPNYVMERDFCMKVRAACVPGRPGCVLRNNSVFAVPVEERLRERELGDAASSRKPAKDLAASLIIVEGRSGSYPHPPIRS